MCPDSRITPAGQAIIDAAALDLSEIVGHPILLFSEQFPTQPLQSRVLDAHGTTFSLDRAGSGRRVDNLVHNQAVTMQFSYRGERVSIRAQLKRTAGGKCNIHLDDHITVLTRRRFWRADLQLSTRLTVLPMSTLHTRDVAKLRWLQVDTMNFSSGGALIELTSYLEANGFILMNIEQELVDFPALIVGRVRHCHQVKSGRFQIGLEFVLREDKDEHFSEAATRSLPPVVFEYNRKLRHWLNGQLIAQFATNDSI